MVKRIDRREFLTTSAGAAALGGVFVNTIAAAPSKSPNEKLNIACVGTANRALGDIKGVKSENIIALCDVDANYLGKQAKEFPKARTYRDFRVMLDKERKELDAVVVGTADHTHAPATAMALRMGLHAYCEKPLTHTVHEARVVAQLAKEKKLATQMGTQIHATTNYRRVVELVQSGAIGPVREVYVWCDKAWSDGRFKFGKPAPANLDWDLWLGPAPKIPYSEGVHPAHWRRFWAFGTGTLGDMGCHVIDLVHWALKLRAPTTIAAEGPPVHPVGTPRWLNVHYEYPARGEMPPVKMHWYDGGHKTPLLSELNDDKDQPLSKWGLGVLFIGDKGKLAANYSKRLLLPKEQFADFKPPEPSIPDSIGHHNEWIQACKTGSPTLCNFDYAGALTEAVLLGTVAYRTGKKLQWDAEALKATNAPEADEFLRKQYREGWTL